MRRYYFTQLVIYNNVILKVADFYRAIIYKQTKTYTFLVLTMALQTIEVGSHYVICLPMPQIFTTFSMTEIFFVFFPVGCNGLNRGLRYT